MLGTGGYGHGYKYTFLALLLLVALAAHVRWVWDLAVNEGPTPRRRGVHALLVLAAAATPLIGYYAARIFFGLKAGKTGRPMTWRTIAMPALALCAVLYCAIKRDAQYIVEHRSWSQVFDFSITMAVLYLVIQAIVYMVASVFGRSRAGPLASRTHLVSSAALVWVTVTSA
jgi:hypothetical protein